MTGVHCDARKLSGGSSERVWYVYLLFGEARIHHEDDAVDSEGCFGDISAHHDFATRYASCKQTVSKAEGE